MTWSARAAHTGGDRADADFGDQLTDTSPSGFGDRA
jgi:hypothetical protein